MSKHRVLAGLAAVLAASSLGYADIFNTTQGTGPFPTIQAAIDGADDNDVIEIRGDILLPDDQGFGFIMTRPLTVQGDGSNPTLTFGTAYGFGAGILATSGTAIIKDLAIDGAGQGVAAVRAVGANMTLENVAISGAKVGFQTVEPNGTHTIDNCAISGGDAAVEFLVGGGNQITVRNGSVLSGALFGAWINPGLDGSSLVVSDSLVEGNSVAGIRVEGNNSLVTLQSDTVVRGNGTFGVVVESGATGNSIDISDTVLDSNGDWHILIGNGAPQGNLDITRTTFWGGASGANPIGGFDVMAADISYTIMANWRAGSGFEGVNACCGFAGTISESVLVNDDLVPANPDPLVPQSTVITTLVFPQVRTFEAGNKFSVFFDTNPASPDFLTLNADPKDGDQTVAAAHLIDEENNAGARPVGGFVSFTNVDDWSKY